MSEVSSLLGHMMPSEMQKVLALAIKIADDSARSEVELYAKSEWVSPEPDAAKYPIYSITESVPVNDGLFSQEITHEDAIRGLQIVQRAANYIRSRGNVFPWRMIEVDGRPGYVRFVDREGRLLTAGEG